MAEPTGLFVEITLDDSGVKKLLNHRFVLAQYGNKLGYYFSELLHQRAQEPGNVFLFHYNSQTGRLFIAYLLNHFTKDLLEPFDHVLPILAAANQSATLDYAVVMTTFPEVLYGFVLRPGDVKKIEASKVPLDQVKLLSNTFLSLSEKNDFPEPEKALKKRNYFHKNFKNYYQKYLVHIEESLKPQRIAEATKKKPYHLFDNFYTFDNKVFEFRSYNDQILELPQADPLTFGHKGQWADKTHVYDVRLAEGSPSNNRPGGRNNPDAKWEWYIVEGIDGGSYEYIKERWDTVYYRDKNHVYYDLKRIEAADRDSFEYVDFIFGKDKYHVFCYDHIIPIDPNAYVLDPNGFLHDQRNIYHFENPIPLDAPSFRVVDRKPSGHHFHPIFILEDKNGTYEYNRIWEGDKTRPIKS